MILERRRVCIFCIVDGSFVDAVRFFIIDKFRKHFLMTESVVPPLSLLSLFENAQFADSIDLHHTLLVFGFLLHSFY